MSVGGFITLILRFGFRYLLLVIGHSSKYYSLQGTVHEFTKDCVSSFLGTVYRFIIQYLLFIIRYSLSERSERFRGQLGYTDSEINLLLILFVYILLGF